MTLYNAPDKNAGDQWSSAEHNQLKAAHNAVCNGLTTETAARVAGDAASSAGIATNAADIATNAADIATNAASVATNAAAIASSGLQVFAVFAGPDLALAANTKTNVGAPNSALTGADGTLVVFDTDGGRLEAVILGGAGIYQRDFAGSTPFSVSISSTGQLTIEADSSDTVYAAWVIQF